MDAIAWMMLTGGMLLLGVGAVVSLGLISDFPRHRATWAVLMGVAAVLFGLARLPLFASQTWMRLAGVACLIAAALFQWRAIQRIREGREKEWE